MNRGITELATSDLMAALEGVLLPRFAEILRTREAGHCMKVTDLDRELMVRLCGGLRSQVPSATAVILADEGLRQAAPDFAVSSTKLVELRNPLPNDELRPPLLVFVPNDLRASAEDSFGVATFEELSLEGAYGELIDQLIEAIPAGIRSAVRVVLSDLRDGPSHWQFADDLASVRFLLTGRLNDFDPEALGAALFELALIPDFELLQVPEQSPRRIARNRECVERITWSTRSERARALDLGLSDPSLCRKLGGFFAQTGIGDPHSWTRAIVTDSANWRLAFNYWRFEDGGVNPNSLFIGDLDLPDLPIVKEDEANPKLFEFIGHPVLPIARNGLKKFSVSFRVNPIPSKVQGVDHFIAEVISTVNGPTGLRRRKAAWVTPKDSSTIAFLAIGKISWEEGWHFVRVYAETQDGDRIPLVDEGGTALARADGTFENGHRPNESSPFYVLTEEDVEVEPPQRAVPRDASLLHALFRAKFAAVVQDREPDAIIVTGKRWSERSGRGKPAGTDVLEVKLGKEGRAHVLISSVLAEVEREFLANPEAINRLHLESLAGGAISRGSTSFCWPAHEEATRFVAARRALFEAIRQGDEGLVMQASNLPEFREQVANYAGAYVDWLQGALARSGNPATARSGLEELRYALSTDTVSVIIHDYRGRRREALLLAPTHPFRANWHTTWALLGEQWLMGSRRAEKRFVVPTREAFLKYLAPGEAPLALPFPGDFGRMALAVDHVNPFWSLYAAADEIDPRGLVGEVCSMLRLPEPAIGGSVIDSSYLAGRVQRYLIQHPYVTTLRINAFNPGRAGVLANMLVAIQKRPEFADLRYDVSLFVPDPESPTNGEALVELLVPDSAVNAQEADAFSTPTESHLHPKLRLAIKSIGEFRSHADANPAHLSFLFDVFPAEEIRAADARVSDPCSQVHGLMQPFAAEYLEDEQSITWQKRPLHGRAQPVDQAEEFTDLLATASRLLSVGLATIARGQNQPSSRPVVALSLSAEERALLHQVHEVSDWVFTIDRNLGIEFFDHRRHPTRPDYLIDHSPDLANALGHRLAITSRSVTELEALLGPVLDDYRLPSTSRHALVLLDQLRFLSGRLALKLLSSPAQRAEALGLALSRLFLEHQGVFQNQVVVPLDAHLELYNALNQNALELGDEVSFRRTDLALFDLNGGNRTLTCRLVEVKCYSNVGGIGAYEQLKSSVAEQIAQTAEVLTFHFDPHRHEIDRPDRTIKNRDLAALLQFYLDRAERHGMVFPEVADEARFFLRHLDEAPYRLNFTRSAVLFDFEKDGTEPAQMEAGIEFYRIGRDLIEQLIEAAVIETESSLSQAARPEPGSSVEMSGELERRRNLAPRVPTYSSAAFLSPNRDRTVSWDRDATGSYERTETIVETIAENKPKEEDSDSLNKTSSASRKADEIAVGAPAEVPRCEVLLGATSTSPQFGILGDYSGRKIGLDLNQTHTISLFGVQGGGKSYTLGSIVEMATINIPAINALPRPLATIIFHYSPTMDYSPEFTSMIAANSVEDQVRQLRATYGAAPQSLNDVVLLVPADKLADRRAEYPNLEILPLQFGAAELKASHWKFLMGAVGNQATYIRQLFRLMKSMRDKITLEGLQAGIEGMSVPDHLKDLARTRLELAAEFIRDGAPVSSLVRPGRLIIVDLRDEFIEKDEALGLFVVLLQLFADTQFDGQGFNKLVVFDEAHKYIESPDLVAGLVEVVREMRHKGVSILVASQDPPSVPVSLIELSSQVILHKFNSPAWLKHIQKANAALGNLTPERMALLKAGEAYIWSSKATDDAFSKGAVKITCRPRVTQHGGATKVAVKVSP